MNRLNYLRFLVVTFLTFSLIGCASTADSTTIPIKEFSRKNTFGDGYVAHVLIEDVKQKDPKEIVNILLAQWLEHCKTENAYTEVQLKDYRIDEITIISVNENSAPYIKAQVLFSIVPVQSPNEWGAAVISIDDPWLNLSVDFGVFVNEEVYLNYYWLETMPNHG